MAEFRRPRRKSRRRQPLPAEALERWVVAGFLLLVVILPFPLGTTATRLYPMLAARVVVVGLFALAVANAYRQEKPFRITSLWAVLAVGALFALLQLVPLPPFLIEWLSPNAAKIYRTALDSLGLYGQGQWRPLALDPAETWHGLSGYAALLMVFLVGANLFSHGDAFKRLLQAVAAAGFLVAMLGFIQKALGLSKIYGVVPFTAETPFFFSCFVNPNNLAGFLGMSVPLQIGLAVKEDDRQGRLMYLFMAVVTATGVFLSLSRGGIIAFIAGQLLLAFLLWRRRDDRPALLWVQGAVLLALVLSAWLALHEIVGEFSFSDGASPATAVTRQVLWEDTARMAAAFPVAGIGVEGFDVAYPIYKTALLDKRFVYPENILLQILVESGAVVGLAVILALGAWLWRFVSRAHLKRLEMAAIAAIVVVAIHNYVDFNLNAYATAVPFMLLIGATSARTAETATRRFFKLYALPLPALAVFGLIAAALVAYGETQWATQRLEKSRASLHRTAYDRTLPRPVFEATLKEAVVRHPADYYLHLLAAERYLAGSRSAYPMKRFHLDKARALNPSDPQVEVQAARAMAAVGDRDGACDAYRRAIDKTLSNLPIEDLWADMLKRGLTANDLVAVTPETPARRMALADFLVSHDHAATAKAILNALAQTETDQAPDTLLLIGRLDLADGKPEEARLTAQRLLRLFPDRHHGYFLMGKIALREGENRLALDWFNRASALAPVDLELWYAMAWTHIRLKNLDEASALALKIHGLSWKHPGRKTNAFLLSGQIEEAKGRYQAARREYERALTYEPNNGAIHFNVGRTYAAEENREDALASYRKAWALGERNRDLDEALRRLERPAPAPSEGDAP
ncbi:MAG: hypothetical protein C4523_04870 [Myxococcales bacterium]|nr:MAG: hypothetical protein C4523_04870 [Myxococcales bacterium]